MIIRCHRGVITLGEGGWTDWAEGAGEWGEIVVAGPHVNVEEGDDPEAFALSKIVDPQGRIWHRMGDTGYLDAGGVLYLTGRLSDLIETERGTLFPYPIEAIARSVEGVKDAYLINHEGCPTVVIETIPGIRIADTLQAARNTLQIHGVDHVTWCKQLPRDHRHNSKVDPDALRRILNRRHP
jgi:acyl-CoA synthetase (AMP-forming)/AMP-acid ligase II